MTYPLDLYVLVADLDQQQALKALLDHRGSSLGIRSVRFELTKHPHHDAGCYQTSPVILQTIQSQSRHALVVLDREGCGAEERTREEIEADLDERLAESGWGNRARSIVLDPEVEIWVWTPSPHVAEVLGWAGADPPLQQWLKERGFLEEDELKPKRPKEAMRAALYHRGIKPSAALFGELARKVGLTQCQDSSFLRLREILREWFPAAGIAI
jgi:hypothetical protein